ncbi:MAG: peptide-methionine (S)-S-oxide reductase MsrA [Candidatus Binatia bacterium]
MIDDARPTRAAITTVLAAWTAAAGLAALALAPASPRAAEEEGVRERPAALAGDREPAVATFAGGCFWCMEPPFDKTDGVIETIAGYTGGNTANPTYKSVSSGTTGHTEAIEVRYDPGQVSYAELVGIFWRNVDPTTPDQQFCDVGSQYRAAIFYHDEEQQEIAQRTRKEIEAAGTLPSPIVTQIVAASKFYPAEEYHQNYYEKNPLRYKYYRWNCGRDQTLEKLWSGNDDS